MKKKIFVLIITALINADYAKPQACGQAFFGPAPSNILPTLNQVPVFGPTNGCIMAGIITDNGTAVGIGITTPNFLLHMDGGAANTIYTQWTNNGTGNANTNGLLMGIDNASSYGIGTAEIR